MDEWPYGLGSSFCVHFVLLAFWIDSAFGQRKNSATSTAMVAMVLQNSFIDQTSVMRAGAWLG
jgi:hypothetical protein